MSMHKVVLVDDESYNFDLFRLAAKSINNIEICACVSDPRAAAASIEETGADLVFTDIEMPEMTGIELAEQLIDKKCDIVFLTAFSQYAVNAFHVNAIDYLLKPVMEDELRRVMDKIDRLHQNDPGLVSGNEALDHIPEYRLQMTGKLQLTADGQPADLHFYTAKSEELFCLLLLKGPQNVDKTLLCDLLWPEADPQKAYTNLYTSFYRLKKTVAEYLCFQLSGKNNCYSLLMNNVVSDYNSFLNTAGTLSREPEKPTDLTALSNVLSLYHGSLLGDRGYGWLIPIREELDRKYLHLIYEVIRMTAGRSEYSAIITLLENAFRFFPYDETICISLAEAAWMEGRKAYALHVIKEHIRASEEMMDMKPSEKILKIQRKFMTDAR